MSHTIEDKPTEAVKPKRTFKKALTIKAMKVLEISLEKVVKEQGLKERSLGGMKLTWDNLIRFANTGIESGPAFTEDDPVSEIMEVFSEMGKDGFLELKSPISSKNSN